MAQVSKDMTIAEVLRLNRETGPIFLNFGMHCITCPVASAESIEEASSVHGIDADALVKALNDFLATQ
jgi:hybrid cluster-associated redox disulfide protein